MNVIDVLIMLFFLSALVRGIEHGLMQQICSTAGLILGILFGVLVQGKIIHLADDPASKALLVLITILTAIAIFGTLGDYLGGLLKSRVEQAKIKALAFIDKGAGSIIAGATLLLAVWLGAAIFNSVPMPWLERQLKNSVIVAELNKTLPPAPDIVAKLGHLIDPNSFPNVFTGLEPRIDTSKPLPSIGELDEAVQKTRASVVKIEGKGCGGISQGSGFVADTNLVITNAHVVAGVEQPYILDGNGRHPAEVLWFDPELDMSVLRTSGLKGAPLPLRADLTASGAPAAVLGYPGGGDFSAHPAVVVDSFKAIGRDIYNQSKTSREVYSLKADIRPGNSGGPLIDKTGNVIGLIFAESTTYDDVGYALTMARVVEGLEQAKNRGTTTLTGSCTQ